MRQIPLCLALGLATAAPVIGQTTCTRPATIHRAPSPQRLAAVQAMHQACGVYFAAYCSGVPAACGERRQCLLSHAGQLSVACIGAIQNLHTTR